MTPWRNGNASDSRPEDWGCSSNGRASALHAEGTGIDTLLLHFFLMIRTKSSAQPESNPPALPTELYADVVSSN